jgi:hypothetical protein
VPRALLVVGDLLQRLLRAGATGQNGGAIGGLRFRLAEATAGGLLGALADGVLGLVAGVFLGLAALRLGALARQALGFLARAAARSPRRGGAPRPRAPWHRQGAGAGVDLVGGKLTEDQPGAGARRGGFGRRRLGRHGRRLGHASNRCGRRRLGLLGDRQRTDAALLALDLHRVGAAVRKALADGVALDAASRLQAEGPPGHADRLVAGVLAFSHAFLWSRGQVIQFGQGVKFSGASAVKETVVAAITDEIPDPRQYVVARGPREQRCMYHICSAECQIQFCPGETTDNGKFPLAEAAAGGAGELGDAIGAGLGRMDQRDHGVVAGQRRLDLAEAADHHAGLAGQRQGAGGGGKE